MTDNPLMRVTRRSGPLARLRERIKRRNDRGATLVEAAFVTPVFVMMLFGIFEFSGYVSAVTGANAATKAGARMATVMGNDPMADRAILKRMSIEGAGLVSSNDVILQIKIWKASGPNDSAPATCNAASLCNLYLNPNQTGGAYSKARLPLTTDPPNSINSPATMSPSYAQCYFGYGSPGMDNPGLGCPDSSRLDKGWPPGTRRVLIKNPNNPTCPNPPTVGQPVTCNMSDYVGIWVQVRHRYYTGFFGSAVTVTSQVVATIEPQGYDK
ncbi:MAG: pilus assembly protein [Actinobacteria bacterium]|nr:pilus assembly protein [Actinomycetota bacterium]